MTLDQVKFRKGKIYSSTFDVKVNIKQLETQNNHNLQKKKKIGWLLS